MEHIPLRRVRFTFALVFLAVPSWCSSTTLASEGQAPLKNGWEKILDLPAVNSPIGEMLSPAKVRLWVEQDWLCVRRINADGEIEWQVVLAKVAENVVPQIDVDETSASLEISYGDYSIRDTFGRMTIFRQKKGLFDKSWPQLTLKGNTSREMGSSGGLTGRINGTRIDEWCWAKSGTFGDQFDIWLRLEHEKFNKCFDNSSNGFQGSLTELRMWYGNRSVKQIGELFIAQWDPSDLVKKALAQQQFREHFSKQPIPEIATQQWLNTSEPMSLEMRRGNVVLLDFFGMWFAPCDEDLPELEALQKKYRDRGLIVIGISTEKGSSAIPAAIKEHSISFPIAIDAGETAKSFGVEVWPSYFLIDKSGNLSRGFSTTIPSNEEIERLLK